MVKRFTRSELAEFGKDNETIYLALNGIVFDVSPGREFYGKDGPYAVFAGKDSTFGLATMSMTVHAKNPRELNEREKDIAADWEKRFRIKYGVVGELAD